MKTHLPENNEITYMDDFSENESQDNIGSDTEEQEDSKDYCKGGYHLVRIGDLYNVRYRVIRKMSWDYFSTNWLCWDVRSSSYVVLKIMKSDERCTERAIYGLQLLKYLRGSDPNHNFMNKTLQLLDDFEITGSNGTHICTVSEVVSFDLRTVICSNDHQGFSLNSVKNIILQVLQGLQYLHEKCKVIHTDIKPANIWVCTSQEQIKKTAYETIEKIRLGLKMEPGYVANFEVNKVTNIAMSKNKKKKLKKKMKVMQAAMDSLTIASEHDSIINTQNLPPNLVSAHNADVVQSENLNLQGKDSSLIWEAIISDNELLHERASTLQDVLEKNKENPTGTKVNNGTNVVTSKNKKKKLKKKMKSMEAAMDSLTIASEHDSIINTQNSPPNLVSAHNADVVWEAIISDNELPHERASTLQDVVEKHKINLAGTKDIDVTRNLIDGVYKEAVNRETCVDPTTTTKFRDEYDLENVKIIIDDLSKACWTYEHLSKDIQTKQYKSPEVLIGKGFDETADIWSTACLAFELATGEYLFDPLSGKDFLREDHMAHMIELLGPIPKSFAMSGKYSRDIFNKRGQLKHIKDLYQWNLFELFTEINWSDEDAKEFESFLLPMLEYDPKKRASAAECLKHPFLNQK